MIVFVTFTDDWQQATARLSDFMYSVPTSAPVSVIRVFIVVSDQQCDDSVLREVVTTLLSSFIDVLRLNAAVLVKVCDTCSYIHAYSFR